jgi:VWFA-related protein
MRNLYYLFLFLFCYSAYSQSLSVFNVDAGSFPTIKAKFYAFDASGNQITNLLPSDFEVKENGQPRTVSLVSCPIPQPPAPLSSVLVMDVSGSMCGYGLDIAKAATNAWIDLLPLGISECAITSFSDANYINQDFTIDKSKLVNGINSLTCIGGTNYNAAMINAMAGGILIAKKGIHKRVIVFLTDGGPNFEPNTTQIISQANANNITIFCVTIGTSAPQCMKDFANQTGGLYVENIRTKEEAEDCYRKILQTAQGSEPCDIAWQSGITCTTGITNVELRITNLGLKANTSYQSPNTSVANLKFNPLSVNFSNIELGKKKDTTITVTAKYSNFNITNIISSNPAFEITPTSFSLASGESKNLTVSYLPADSGYTYSKFTIENDLCPTQYYASGGFPGLKPKIRTLKLIHPNGGQVFVVGMDTVITWEGVLPDEKVIIDYSTNNGTSWIVIADSAAGLSYKWRVPKTPSNNCLARVTAKLGYVNNGCESGEIQICKQVWMCRNLDVETYRNGDRIPEVTDPTQWANLKTGAWCNYKNDPAMGEIYGKLYNWYAVNDKVHGGLAPVGWHVSTNAEWTELETCLGGSDVAGGKLKSTGTIENGDGLWLSPNTGATNLSGFSGLPGGYRFVNGNCYGVGDSGQWWTSSVGNAASAWGSYLYSNSTIVGSYYNGKVCGFSVRCVKD